MYNLLINHSPMEVCYLVAKDAEGNLAYMLSITPTAFFDLRERATGNSLPRSKINHSMKNGDILS